MGDARPLLPASRRARRRGPRSIVALSRRRRAPPGGAGGEPSAIPSVPVSPITSPQEFLILLVNVRSINEAARRAELSACLLLHDPEVVCITETWLDASTKYVDIPGYALVSRRDRPSLVPGAQNYGGVVQ